MIRTVFVWIEVPSRIEAPQVLERNKLSIFSQLDINWQSHLVTYCQLISCMKLFCERNVTFSKFSLICAISQFYAAEAPKKIIFFEKRHPLKFGLGTGVICYKILHSELPFRGSMEWNGVIQNNQNTHFLCRVTSNAIFLPFFHTCFGMWLVITLQICYHICNCTCYCTCHEYLYQVQ